ncbi:MAG: VWA domain-containing protein, partial [Bacteroidetes bacterium]|nr:VWA domain-containing protein [Bacteroidota bacterium]
HTELSANILAFCRFLRQKGFPIGPIEIADAIKTLEYLPFTDREMMRESLRVVIPKSQEQQEIFDDLYPDFWANLEKAVDSKIKEEPEKSAENKSTPRPEKQKTGFDTLKDWLQGKKQTEEKELAVYSANKVITERDFSTFMPTELKEVTQLIILMAKALAFQQNRRFKSTHKHRDLDIRKTIRLNMRRGGEILDLAYRKERIQKIQLVMICDVSKSMDLYSRFLIQFIYAFQSVYRRVETFVFSTSLHRITDTLKDKSFDLAMLHLSETVKDWSGGTRIGSSLSSFYEEHGNKYLNKDTVVLIMSDGWDTGEVGLMTESMQHIHRKAGKVIWLNPLSGNTAFSPEVQGLKAAMPYIDVFVPGHNIDSLRKMIKHLR